MYVLFLGVVGVYLGALPGYDIIQRPKMYPSVWSGVDAKPPVFAGRFENNTRTFCAVLDIPGRLTLRRN
jgi:hypothetical protein